MSKQNNHEKDTTKSAELIESTALIDSTSGESTELIDSTSGESGKSRGDMVTVKKNYRRHVKCCEK